MHHGPSVRIKITRPLDGQIVEFEAGCPTPRVAQVGRLGVL